MIPVAVTPGNVGVCFDILSYAGDLVVTVVADPDVVAEQDLLTVCWPRNWVSFSCERSRNCR